MQLTPPFGSHTAARRHGHSYIGQVDACSRSSPFSHHHSELSAGVALALALLQSLEVELAGVHVAGVLHESHTTDAPFT